MELEGGSYAGGSIYEKTKSFFVAPFPLDGVAMPETKPEKNMDVIVQALFSFPSRMKWRYVKYAGPMQGP